MRNAKAFLGRKAFVAGLLILGLGWVGDKAQASSHREAPLISNDPVADNTDLYAFRSPDDPTTVTIIANYIPFELPEGGPNYFSFAENVRYEIHIKNAAANPSRDDITYRFTFTQTNEDATTFFNIRLGKQNLKTTYMCQVSRDGGANWTTIVTDGIVPPANIGPRSIEGGAGLNTAYSALMSSAIAKPATGEKIFCGPVDDPFFVDLAGIFDLGGFRAKGQDALAGFNCHTIALKIPIAMLQKDGKSVSQAANILDPDFVIGVWASASRPKITTLSSDGSKPTYSQEYVQVSRLGMPLTNEAIIPIGLKDKWNAIAANSPGELDYIGYFTNPELALYIGNGPFSAAVPGLAALKIDSNSLGAGFDFRNNHDGLYGLYATNAGAGTALDTNGYGKVLLQKGAPRSIDLLPIFYTGAPNLAPYQLATGKTAGPLSAGKPFINNFLPTLGDMLRLNMAVPVTPRNDPNFSRLGLIQAAAIGLTVAPYNTTTNLENIPNMDGFPNGRRLEDDVTTIEMQAVGGLVLNAIGLWTDDYAGTGSPVTPNLLAKLTWSAGVDGNDVAFTSSFPFEAMPHAGADGLKRATASVHATPNGVHLAIPPATFLGQNFPNPAANSSVLNFRTTESGNVRLSIVDIQGREVAVLADDHFSTGNHAAEWHAAQGLANGTYYASLSFNGARTQSMKLTLNR